MKIEKNVGEGYKNDEITSNVLKMVKKNVGEGWSQINSFPPGIQ